MKAIIPVAGAGTKLRPHTYTQPKVLMPLAGKNILSVIIDKLLAGGITEFIFVVGYMGNKIIDHVRQFYPDLQASFIMQECREGIGHAIWLAKDEVKEDELLIVLGDTICDIDFPAFLGSAVSEIAIKRVDDPREFGVAELDDKGYVDKVVEKPLIPVSNMAMVGIYYIKETQQFFDILDNYMHEKAESDGEFHLTHALQLMLDRGIKFKGVKVKNWFDVGKKESLLETNALLLKQLNEREQYSLPQYEGSVVIPPVSIGKNCVIKNSIIGPYVSLGDNVSIKSSIIKKSIVASYASLKEVVMKSSIIGNDASVRGVSQSLNIGDNTEIDLG